MKAKRMVEIYAIVQVGAFDYKVYPSGRVWFWDADMKWEELQPQHYLYEAIRDAGLKAINEDQQ